MGHLNKKKRRRKEKKERDRKEKENVANLLRRGNLTDDELKVVIKYIIKTVGYVDGFMLGIFDIDIASLM